MNRNVAFPLLLLALATSLSACFDDFNDCYRGNGIVGSIEFELETIREVEINSSIDVILVRDTVSKAILEGDDNLLDLVNTRVIGNRFQVEYSNQFNCVRPRLQMVMELHIDTLDEIEIDGSGDLSSDGPITSEHLRLLIHGSGDIEIESYPSSLEVEVAGSGNTELKGNCSNAYAHIRGSGNLDLFRFPIDSLDVIVDGSGNTKAEVNDRIRIWIDGSGNVTFRGDADLIIQQNDGSGVVTRL